jgi:F-type H+-transporting ATPase subunit epsilon
VLVTPRRKVLEIEVDEVRLPGTLGELGVLPGHTPLLTSLGVGPLTYFEGRDTSRLAIRDGFAEILPDRVTVLARVAERPDEVDVEAARHDVVSAEEALRTASSEELDELNARLRMAATRLEIADVN